MTESERELAGFAGAAGLLAALYALQRSQGANGLSGLGDTGGITIGVKGDTLGRNGPYTPGPGSWIYVNICGLQKGDVVTWNRTQVFKAASFVSDFDPGWTPGRPGAVMGATVGSEQIVEQIGASGCLQQGITTPLTAGTYTILVAVNGQLRYQYTLNVTGTPGAWASGGGIAVGAPGAPVSNPLAAATSGPSIAPVSTSLIPVSTPLTSGLLTGSSSPAVQPMSSAAAAPAATAASAASGATIQMTPASTGGITGILETSLFGVPLWALLAAGAGLVWYMTTKGITEMLNLHILVHAPAAGQVAKKILAAQGITFTESAGGDLTVPLSAMPPDLQRMLSGKLMAVANVRCRPKKRRTRPRRRRHSRNRAVPASRRAIRRCSSATLSRLPHQVTGCLRHL